MFSVHQLSSNASRFFSYRWIGGGVKGDRENNKSFLKIVSPLLHSAQLHFNIPLIYIIIIYV